MIGGSYGKGQVYQNNKVTGKTSVVEGSIGFLLGSEAFSEIIFFKDDPDYALRGAIIEKVKSRVQGRLRRGQPGRSIETVTPTVRLIGQNPTMKGNLK